MEAPNQTEYFFRLVRRDFTRFPRFEGSGNGWTADF